MNPQATVLQPSTAGRPDGPLLIPLGRPESTPSLGPALSCQEPAELGGRDSVIRSPDWGFPRSACPCPPLLFLVFRVCWPGTTVYLLGPTREAGRRVVTMLLALVTRAWLSCSHLNQLYPTEAPSLTFLLGSGSLRVPHPPSWSPQSSAVQVFQLQGSETNSSFHKPQRDLLGDSCGASRTEGATGHTGLRRCCSELTAASRLAALHPGQPLRCLSLSLLFPVLFPSERSRHLGLGRVSSCRWASPGLSRGRELLGRQCHPSPLLPGALTRATLSVLQGLLCPPQEAPLHAQPSSCCIWWGGPVSAEQPVVCPV